MTERIIVMEYGFRDENGHVTLWDRDTQAACDVKPPGSKLVKRRIETNVGDWYRS